MLLLFLFLILFTVTYIGRIIVTDRMLANLKKHDRRPRTVIIGLSEESVALATKLSSPDSKPRIGLIAFLPIGNEKIPSEKLTQFKDVSILEGMGALKEMCTLNMVDQVIIVPPAGKTSYKKILYFLYHLYPFDISIKINPDIFSIITPTIRLEDILGEPFIDLSRPQISEFSKNVKRTLDVLISGVGLLILSPFLAMIAAGVKMSGPGKVFYTQERIGRHRKPFRIIKFRSMNEDAEKDGVPRLSGDNDARITRMGRWMRKYRIDELPQFWNVLKGEMSLVGPRPEREYFIEQIVKKAPWYTLVLQVRPGITSWGMVKYGYATNTDQMIERNRFDLIYLTNMSVVVDFKILIHTIKTVGSGAGK